MFKVQNFWKILEGPGLSDFGKSVLPSDNRNTKGARISQCSQQQGISKQSPTPKSRNRRRSDSEVTQRLPASSGISKIMQNHTGSHRPCWDMQDQQDQADT